MTFHHIQDYFFIESLPIRPVLIHIEYGEEKRIKTLNVLVYSEKSCFK